MKLSLQMFAQWLQSCNTFTINPTTKIFFRALNKLSEIPQTDTELSPPSG